MRLRTHSRPVNLRLALVAKREQLVRGLNKRSRVEKALTDNDPLMLLALLAVGAIFALELSANLANPKGWSSWAHLAVIGPLECLILYVLFSAARAAIYRRRLENIDRLLGQITPH